MNHLISPNLVDSKPKSTAASRGSSRSSSRTNDAGNSYRDELTSLMDQKSKSSSSYSYSSKNNPRNQGASVSSSAPQAMLGSGNVEKGDLNEDGVVELLDRKLTSDYFFGRKVTYNLKNADFGDDGNVNVADLFDMEQKLGRIEAAKNVIKGDANSDGKVDEADLEHMAKYMKGKTSSINLSAVDADWNGKITATDLSELAKLIAKQKANGTNSNQANAGDSTAQGAKITDGNTNISNTALGGDTSVSSIIKIKIPSGFASDNESVKKLLEDLEGEINFVEDTAMIKDTPGLFYITGEDALYYNYRCIDERNYMRSGIRDSFNIPSEDFNCEIGYVDKDCKLYFAEGDYIVHVTAGDDGTTSILTNKGALIAFKQPFDYIRAC